ncbi:uncharacterized protein LAJ45_02410 [Morchella importuna]|uniref:uncharacterized protein n=1 Tax=Morchella importuna TaxID=1174673 RepID=UPI001E8E7AED|nr:uncharacterized protein LAJ45_02410 [Morchella importuna]KAH8153597.1 hypothetical protein LAJ45_02410 [Morchella importuna]
MFGKRFFGLRGPKLNYAISIIAGIDFLLFGYDQGVMGGLLTLKSFTKVFPEMDTSESLPAHVRSRNAEVQGVAISMYNIGCFCGALACLYLGDKLGRRKTLFTGAMIMVIGAILQTTAYSLGHFITGRLVTGFGNGLNTATVPVWQSECSKSHDRGRLLMIEGALVTGGIMISYWIDFGFSFLEPSEISWRFPIAFQIVFALVIVIFILPLPGSPRWLLLKGRETEALEVLTALDDVPADDPQVMGELAEIKTALEETAAATFKDLFTMDENRNFHRVVLGYMIQVFQQISGINLITYYAATIYEQYIHLEPLLARILAACNGTEYFLASWISVFIIEKVGRRKLLLWSTAGMSASMAILAIMTSIGGGATGIVAAIFLFVFNTFFAVGWLGMAWLYPAEVTPLRIRARANSLSTSANWIFNFMVVMITPVAFANIQYRTYIIFAVINAAIIPCLYWFYPETAYRSLEEMDNIFKKSKSIWDTVRIAAQEPLRHGKHGELLVIPDAERRASDLTKTESKAEHREYIDGSSETI